MRKKDSTSFNLLLRVPATYPGYSSGKAGTNYWDSSKYTLSAWGINRQTNSTDDSR